MMMTHFGRHGMVSSGGDGGQAEEGVTEKEMSAEERLEQQRQQQDEAISQLQEEFRKCWIAWLAAEKKINWKETKKLNGSVVTCVRTTDRIVGADCKLEWRELWDVDVGLVMKQEIIDKDPDGTIYGYLPQMATFSKGSIGCLLASSFCERINSCANQVVTDGNTWLSDKEMEMVVMLRMNGPFITFMREQHPHVVKEQFGQFGTVLTKAANTEDDVKSEDV